MKHEDEVTRALTVLGRGIRMLGVMPSEHAQSATYNEALHCAAAYVRSFIGREDNLSAGFPAAREAQVPDVGPLVSDGEIPIVYHREQELLARLAAAEGERDQAQDEAQENWQSVKTWKARADQAEADLATVREERDIHRDFAEKRTTEWLLWRTRAETAEATLATVGALVEQVRQWAFEERADWSERNADRFWQMTRVTAKLDALATVLGAPVSPKDEQTKEQTDARR